jgi:hypothetical protein
MAAPSPDLRHASLSHLHDLAGQLDPGSIPASFNHDLTPDNLQSAYQSQLNIETLLSIMYPSAPMISKGMLPPDCAGMEGGMDGHEEFSPPKSVLYPTPPALQNTIIYVKNLPSVASDLWVYER